MNNRNWLRRVGKYAFFLSAAIMLPTQAASVHWEEAGDEAGSAAGNLWEATKEDTGKTWAATKEASGKAWEATKEGSARAWDKTREVSGEAWDKTRDFTVETWDKATGNAEPGASVDTGGDGSPAADNPPGK